ncbi:MAG TPA: polysaccharide pyruvyl transferase family protein [Candidatus Fermentibacter daniensis]|nr:polysaccharide pyruvyl transferase family protein [Candidatus Fermentibacter daniensis]
MRRPRVFTSSWGQLESAGSNIGDLAVFASQVGELRQDFDIGVVSSDPGRTASEWGARGFSTRRGRLAAMLRGVLWADKVVVGGGELVQDSSSLLYSPFNLLPFRLAALFGKPSFAWLIGLGQGSELRPWTRKGISGCLGLARGISVRDEPSGRLLSDLGFRRDRFLVAADAAFCLCRNRRPGPVVSDLLGAAPRDVSNRTGSLLPLETRRKLGLARDVRDEGTADGWASLLDSHLERNGGRVLLLPFHTGSLSNSDDAMCVAVLERMKHGAAASIFRDTSLDGFLQAIAGCRVMVSTPLHGAILSVVSGALPVAAPYSSKGARFMAEAGLGDLVIDCREPGWWRRASDKVAEAWRTADSRWEALSARREELLAAASANTAYFKSVCAL